MQTSLIRSVLLVAIAASCAGSGQFTYTGTATAPDLVVISPGVQVIADLDEPIFYSDNYYWRNAGGYWYRSSTHTSGFVRANVVPVRIRSISRPAAYVHYRGEARANVPGDRRAPAPTQVVRDHRQDAPAPQRDDRRDRHDDKNKHDDKDKHDQRDRHDDDKDRDRH